MSVVRGRPPGLAGGIRGASRAYCSSLSACPAPKSPTKARFSAVHMACLQEGLFPSLNRRHGHYASSSLSTARTSQTASYLIAATASPLLIAPRPRACHAAPPPDGPTPCSRGGRAPRNLPYALRRDWQ